MLMEPIYNLPKIHFVGGETQPLCFHLKTPSGKNYITEGYEVDFSMTRWGKKGEKPIITKTSSVTLDSTGTGSVFEINLSPADTINLYGRYVYQIMIMGEDDFVEIPGQGIFEIVRNIHPEYIN